MALPAVEHHHYPNCLKMILTQVAEQMPVLPVVPYLHLSSILVLVEQMMEGQLEQRLAWLVELRRRYPSLILALVEQMKEGQPEKRLAWLVELRRHYLSSILAPVEQTMEGQLG